VIAVADPAQVTQVLMNLGVNASQAMRDQRGHIVVTLEQTTIPDAIAQRLGIAAGLYARVTVRDDGMGMSEEVRRRIFEPFFTTKSPDQGTGLGLSVVDGVVRGHGGAVEVTSQPGEGPVSRSCCRPARAPASRPMPARAARSVAARLTRASCCSTTTCTCSARSRVLTRAGYVVNAFSDATQALECWARRRRHGCSSPTGRYRRCRGWRWRAGARAVPTVDRPAGGAVQERTGERRTRRRGLKPIRPGAGRRDQACCR
jgi:hypothetical protein